MCIVKSIAIINLLSTLYEGLLSSVLCEAKNQHKSSKHLISNYK